MDKAGLDRAENIWVRLSLQVGYTLDGEKSRRLRSFHPKLLDNLKFQGQKVKMMINKNDNSMHNQNDRKHRLV